MLKGIFISRRERTAMENFSHFTFLIWLECGLFSPPSKPTSKNSTWPHPGCVELECSPGTESWEGGVLPTETALGMIPGHRALMRPTVQRRGGGSQGPQILLDLLHLFSCCGPVSLPTGAHLLRAAPCAWHPSSAPLVLTIGKYSLNLIFISLISHIP